MKKKEKLDARNALPNMIPELVDEYERLFPT